MQLKKEFLELSTSFNNNINEDKLLFIGMFLNFYMSKSNFKNKSEVQEHLKLYFNTDKKPIEILKEVINTENTDMNYLLNRLYLALVHKKENKTIDKNTWEHFLENLWIPIKKVAKKTGHFFYFYILYMSLEYYITFLLYFNRK